MVKIWSKEEIKNTKFELLQILKNSPSETFLHFQTELNEDLLLVPLELVDGVMLNSSDEALIPNENPPNTTSNPPEGGWMVVWDFDCGIKNLK